MPRPNQPRNVLAEDHLARRIAIERETRGWTYDGLAARMKAAGCPVDQSAIYKIEKGRPRRRITVDEMVALAEVFDVPIQDLLLPPEVTASRELVRLFVAWNEAREDVGRAEGRETSARSDLRAFIDAHPEADVEAVVGTWVEHYFTEDKRDTANAFWMWNLTGSGDWMRKLNELTDTMIEARDDGER
jgi:transcriptional regulator with XRE-family HTH domain